MPLLSKPPLKAEVKNLNFHYGTRHAIKNLNLPIYEREVIALIMRRAMALTALGVAVGLAGALAGARLLRGLVFGISATDPLTFVGQTALILAACAIASYLPARRASRLDPVQALRGE